MNNRGREVVLRARPGTVREKTMFIRHTHNVRIMQGGLMGRLVHVVVAPKKGLEVRTEGSQGKSTSPHIRCNPKYVLSRKRRTKQMGGEG